MPESYDATDCPPNTANVLHRVKNLSSPAGHDQQTPSSLDYAAAIFNGELIWQLVSPLPCHLGFIESTDDTLSVWTPHLSSSSDEDSKVASLLPALSTSPLAYLATALQDIEQNSKQSACAPRGDQGQSPRKGSYSSPREDSSHLQLGDYGACQVPSLLGMTSTATRLLADMIFI
jgi:hypothetical protein